MDKSTQELSSILREMYEEGLANEKAVASIHLFGIKYRDRLKKVDLKKLAAEATNKESYHSEINKGVNLAVLLQKHNLLKKNHPDLAVSGKQSIKNIMLYGSPGVGKTHNYKRLISMIEEGASEQEIFNTISSNEQTDSFDNSTFEQIKNEGRMQFVTFHQSYSYEDFIEGFRPQENGDIACEDGVCKSFIGAMGVNRRNKQISNISENPSVWTIVLGKNGRFNKDCFKENIILFDGSCKEDLRSLDDIPGESLKTFFDLKIGDIVFAFQDRSNINGIGVITSNYIYDKDRPSYRHTKNVEWIIQDKTVNIAKYEHKKTSIGVALSGLPKCSKNNVLEIIQDNFEEKNHYLVIDEINRGNISKIFGELITLIEEDKRGKKEYEVTLPYSKESFLVPPNLYIIATMNSTDKSIATIDIALRRRFTFLKMLPKLELVKNDEAKGLMDKLNKHITNTLGEDYQLGHSYFMKIENEEDLEFVKEYKIKPLLEEYFYGDEANYKSAIELLYKSEPTTTEESEEPSDPND